MTLKHWLIALVAAPLLLSLVACSGDDDDDDGGSTGSTPTAEASGEDSDDDGSDSGDDDGDDSSSGSSGSEAGDDLAVVTIGDRTFEFDLSTVCLSLGGAIGAAGFATDGSDIDVDIDLPPEDWESSNDGWEPPSIRINVDDPFETWISGDSVFDTPEEAVITSYSIDGRSASGTAVFVETSALGGTESEPIEGTFELSCDEDTYS